MSSWRYLFAFVCFALLLAGCATTQAAQLPEPGSGGDVNSSPGESTKDILTGEAKLPESGREACPVTLPPNTPFTPPEPYPSTAPYSGNFWFGTKDLWTALPANGTWPQLLYGEKVFWWREGYNASEEPQPELAMVARRLDGSTDSAYSGPPATNASHIDFNTAMLLGFQVGTPGCWEITGRYEGHELSFVVWVSP